MAKNAVKEELTNLMDLLDEQNEQAYDQIHNSVLAFGVTAIPFLEETRENAFDSTVQSRIKALIHKIRFQNLYFELHNWATINSNDLLKGHFLISKYVFPDLDEDRVMAQVESLKKEVWLELKQNMTPLEGAKVLSRVFFELKKFSFITNTDGFSESLCLNTLLDSRQGFPNAFSLLYAGIAQRLSLPIYGITKTDSPFLAYVYSKTHQTVDLKKDVLFYLNPFAEGVFFKDLNTIGHQENDNSKEKEECIGACKNPELILQLVKTMQSSFMLSGKTEKVEELSRLKKALEVE